MKRITGLGLLAAGLLLAWSPTAEAQAAGYAERQHARAVQSFRQGRFAEAYGRFVDLANAGHAPSARTALWMCEQGPTLFGSQWDCAPHEVDDWQRLQAAPTALPAAARHGPRSISSPSCARPCPQPPASGPARRPGSG